MDFTIIYYSKEIYILHLNDDSTFLFPWSEFDVLLRCVGKILKLIFRFSSKLHFGYYFSHDEQMIFRMSTNHNYDYLER